MQLSSFVSYNKTIKLRKEDKFMNYEVVNLEEKTVVGLIARTNNMSPDMGMIIGNLWKRFYEDGIYSNIAQKKNEKALGIYTDYAADETGDYSILVACETNHAADIPKETVVRTIPAGKYAKFIVKGDMNKAVAEFWEQLWQMKELNRAFICDFEEYQNEDMENAEIHMYISLKDK